MAQTAAQVDSVFKRIFIKIKAGRLAQVRHALRLRCILAPAKKNKVLAPVKEKAQARFVGRKQACACILKSVVSTIPGSLCERSLA